jgi:serine phosphatase RsbU (regulator of sigma subunit)
MNSESFGIGLYNPVSDSLQFPGFIEKNEKMPFFEFHCSDKDRYAVWCFDKEREIIINDNKLEYSKYIKVLKAPIAGKSPESLIYLPLFTKDKKIGVLTVQSFTKNAYSEYQVNILRNLALSIAIALDNASLYENLEEKVKERTEEVISQKAIIEEKNKDITDSIKYAKKIQQALMPDTDLLKKGFKESFVYYRPKDIVSGDFYWIETFRDDITVFAAADCTGHGVPGAFMSLICNDLMSQVIKDQNVTSPAQVLTILDERLRAMLNKSSDHSSNDGMDIALCAYHPKNKILQFAGAHRPLLLIRNGELIEYKPSKHSIGGYVGGHKLFDDNVIQLQEGDSVYILTDGYSDQFGGQNGKKFKFKKLQKLIQSIAHMSMADQHDLLEEAFISWRGRHEQVDDVCVIGVKI